MLLCLATANLHKIREIQAMLPEGIELIGLDAIGCTTELPETTGTIEGNSRQKAWYVWQHYQVSCLADDSGLEVEALQAAPGVHSAHYSGSRDAQANMNLLLANLAPHTNRKARFRTVITLVINGQIHSFEGIAEGHIGMRKKGDKGFGYDPLFTPDGYTRTFAEMDLDEKNPISHRGKAIQQLNVFLKQLLLS